MHTQQPRSISHTLIVALPQYVRAIEAHDDFVPPYIRLGGVLLADQQARSAQVVFRKALRRDPRSLVARTGLGDALFAQKQVCVCVWLYPIVHV